jgi:hypothetical protein
VQKGLLFTVRAFLNIFSQLAEADVSETLKICCKDRQPRHALSLFPQQQQLTRFQQRQQHAKIPIFINNNGSNPKV